MFFVCVGDRGCVPISCQDLSQRNKKNERLRENSSHDVMNITSTVRTNRSNLKKSLQAVRDGAKTPELIAIARKPISRCVDDGDTERHHNHQQHQQQQGKYDGSRRDLYNGRYLLSRHASCCCRGKVYHVIVAHTLYIPVVHWCRLPFPSFIQRQRTNGHHKMDIQPPQHVRRFGTDLTKTLVASDNKSNQRPISVTLKTPSTTGKKAVRVRKPSSNGPTPTPSKSSLKQKTNAMTRDAADEPKPMTKQLENGRYSVTFVPGPIGIQLEPVFETKLGKEEGCRVVRCLDDTDPPGQAHNTGAIQPGDLLVGVNDTDVSVWNYPDTIRLLKSISSHPKRTLVFVAVGRQTKATTMSKPVVTATKTTKGTRKIGAKGGIGTNPKTPVRSKSVRSKAGPRPRNLNSGVFSPSSVKKLASSGTLDTSSRPEPTELSDVLTSVYRNVVPTAGVVVSSSYNLTSSLTSAVSTKLGEALVGHSSHEFENALQTKMQLLTELSHAKASLDTDQEEQKRLQSIIKDISEEKTREEQSNKVTKEKLKAAEADKVCSRR